MYRILSIAGFAVLAFVGGMAAYDLRNADASNVGGGGSSAAAFPYTGAAAISGSLGVTGAVSVTGTLTCTQGVSAVTGSFSGAVAISGSLTMTGPLAMTGSVGITGSSGALAMSIDTTGVNAGGLTVRSSGTGSGIVVTEKSIVTATQRYGVSTTIGNSTAGAALYAAATGANGDAVVGICSGGGYGGYFTSATGYGLLAQGDTTSPAKAAMRIVPQDTDPTSCAIGDLAVVVATLKVCTATNTWTPVH